MTAKFWNKYWNSHPTVDLQEVQEILKSLPRIPPFDAEISVQEVRKAFPG